MAKFNIEFDSKEKTCTASCDGVAIANFHGLEICRSYQTKDDGSPMYDFAMRQREVNTEHKVATQTHTYAALQDSDQPVVTETVDRDELVKSIRESLSKLNK